MSPFSGITTRPWWRWMPGMVVFVEGGPRPVDRAVVVPAGGFWRVVDQWGDLGLISEARTGQVVPDLESAATIGCLLERLREVVQASYLRGPVVLYVDKPWSTVVIGDPSSDVSARYCGDSAASAIIVALDDKAFFLSIIQARKWRDK